MKFSATSAPTPPLRPTRARGGSTMEYLLVVALVVIPLALLSPLIIGMLVHYLGRITTAVRLPFG